VAYAIAVVGAFMSLVRTARLEEMPPAVGGPESFAGFFENEARRLLAALWLVTRNHVEAEEILQEAFLKVWERWDRVSRLDDATGYLYRTALNEHRSRLRRAAVAMRRSFRAPEPDDALRRAEAREALVRALGLLTARQRAAVVVTDLLGYPPNDAAVILGIRPSTVRVLLSRARARMREEIGDIDA
jgi:RNA polymerase sigma-70 factor (ECF subfamily)